VKSKALGGTFLKKSFPQTPFKKLLIGWSDLVPRLDRGAQRDMMEFTFEAEIWSEEGKYVARANPLNVLTCGDTREEAEEALLEAVELFLETAEEMGTLQDILAEAGYAPIQGKWVAMRKPERREMTLRL
jgi:predicted RNase H-like HicB family nuclease